MSRLAAHAILGLFSVSMSTLAEIEAAVEKLSAVEQKALLRLIAERIHSFDASIDDPVTAVIGAFAGEPSDTGRQAEEILYGRGENGDAA